MPTPLNEDFIIVANLSGIHIIQHDGETQTREILEVLRGSPQISLHVNPEHLLTSKSYFKRLIYLEITFKRVDLFSVLILLNIF